MMRRLQLACVAVLVTAAGAFRSTLPRATGTRGRCAGGSRSCVARPAALVRMAASPPPASWGEYEEPESPPAPKPRIDWGAKFKKALDSNPGRSERLGRSEQEQKYKQILASDPADVDALCGYALFLSTVREDYAGAAELYSTAVRTDPSRARRITVQLWADLWAMRAENERADNARNAWRKLLEAADKDGRGTSPPEDVRAVFVRIGVPVPEDAIARATRGGKTYYLELSDALAMVEVPSPARRLLRWLTRR